MSSALFRAHDNTDQPNRFVIPSRAQNFGTVVGEGPAREGSGVLSIDFGFVMLERRVEEMSLRVEIALERHRAADRMSQMYKAIYVF